MLTKEQISVIIDVYKKTHILRWNKKWEFLTDFSEATARESLLK